MIRIVITGSVISVLQTKKKIASATTYDKSKKLMTIKNFKNSDAGEYFSITYHSVSIPKNGG